MKLCVSNIAWNVDEDFAALVLLRSMGVYGLELAPTRWWPDLTQVSNQQATQKRSELGLYGLKATAFQAVLFGHPHLSIFDPLTRNTCRDYLTHVIHLAERMDVSTIVFGSPKNRRRGELSHVQAVVSAVEFFGELSHRAESAGVRICFEPNPAAYGADFGCTVRDSMGIIEAVDSEAFLLNLDLGSVAMNGEDAGDVIRRAGSRIGHVHISEPNMSGFPNPMGPHRDAAEALLSVGYQGNISLEFKRQITGLDAVVDAVNFARLVYRC